MPLTDPLPIQPFTRPVSGEVSLPGSKSITNRALLLAALGDGPCTLAGALFSEDSSLMAAALRNLGFAVREIPKENAIKVDGLRGRIPAGDVELQVGNAGTAARFLTALCAASPRGVYRVDGVSRMRERPMLGLIEALRELGSEIRCNRREGFLPIEIHAHGLSGGRVSVNASESSQMLSALLMAAPLAREPVWIDLSTAVREPFVEMTLRMMAQFGVEVRRSDGAFHVPVARYRSPKVEGAPKGERLYPIEPDATAASYFLALPLVVGGSLRIARLRKPDPSAPALQGDLRFIGVLERTGIAFDDLGGGMKAGFSGPSPAPAPNGPQDFREFSDTFLTLAAVAPLLDGPTRITGIAHTRKQETDRIAGMAAELRKLGQHVAETEDSLEIHPRPLPKPDRPMEIETYGDHRFAMSFGILGCHDRMGNGRPWLSIRNPGCCAKTFPDFFSVLDSLHAEAAPA